MSGGAKKTRGHEDRRESFPYITDKALDVQNTLKHDNKTATLISLTDYNIFYLLNIK